MSETKDQLESFITKGTLKVTGGRKGGFSAEKGVISKGPKADTGFIDLVVEYNQNSGAIFMVSKAPLPLRVYLNNAELDHAFHVAAEALKTAFAQHGIELGKYKGAYSRKDAATNDKGTTKETFWLRYDL